MENANILYEIKNNIGYVTINRPKFLNALNKECLAKLVEILSLWKEDSGCRAVIITGAGEKSFSPGADINVFVEESVDHGALHKLLGKHVGANGMGAQEGVARHRFGWRKGHCSAVLVNHQGAKQADGGHQVVIHLLFVVFVHGVRSSATHAGVRSDQRSVNGGQIDVVSERHSMKHCKSL